MQLHSSIGSSDALLIQEQPFMALPIKTAALHFGPVNKRFCQELSEFWQIIVVEEDVQPGLVFTA